MRENRMSGSEGGGAKPIVSPYPYMLSPASQAEIFGPFPLPRFKIRNSNFSSQMPLGPFVEYVEAPWPSPTCVCV